MAIDIFYENINVILELFTPSTWTTWERCVFVALIFGVIYFIIRKLGDV